MMPPLYLPILEERAKMGRTAIYRAVKNENQRSKAWPHIVQLAKEHQQNQQQLNELLSAG